MAEYGKGYGKRPLWQWILIYLVVGGIIYVVIYFLVIKKNNTYNYTPQASNAPTNTVPGY